MSSGSAYQMSDEWVNTVPDLPEPRGWFTIAAMALPPRDLQAEVARHFHGTPESRILLAWRLGREALDLFHATLPPGTSRAEARRIMQRNTRRGRRPSRAFDADGR